MKSPISYFLISVIIILSVFIATFIWRNQNIKKFPTFQEKSFTAPISSKYIPPNSDLVFHWKLNPSILPNYIENYQDRVTKNSTNKKVRLIRDSTLRLIGLDFTKDISSWAGQYGSFAIFETNKQLLNDWLMVLEINKDVTIDEDLESILEAEIINKNANSIDNLDISKSKLFVKNISSNQSIYFLNEKEHILISSNPKIINSSLDNLNNNTLSKKDKYKQIQIKDNLNDGILLLELSPKKILNLIDEEKDLLGLDQTKKLISSLNIKNNKLIFEGIFIYDVKHKRAINDINNDLTNTEKELDSFDNFILINNPKQYFVNVDSSHPYKKLIASIIRKSTSKDYSKLFKTILENTKGKLIWLKEKEWLAITRKADTNKKDINYILEKDNFSNSNLEFKNKILEIWSKVTTNSNENYEIKENVEAIIEENENVYTWSQDLSSISNFDNKKYLLQTLDYDHTENQNKDFEDVIKVHLGKAKTEIFLNNFYPYILLRTMLGNKLDFPKNIDISVSIPTINYPDFVKFKIDLKTS